MKISKLYCNKPELFGPIEFLPGLNVVMAEIRLPENRKKDTHNLGKTTLCRLLDFGFLEGRDPKFFLFKFVATVTAFVTVGFSHAHHGDGCYTHVAAAGPPRHGEIYWPLL